MDEEAIVQAIKRGIYDSNLECENWSRGDCWLIDSAAGERIMVHGIARSLYERALGENESLRLEWRFGEIVPNIQTPDRLVDIAVLNQNRSTIIVVEVKIRWDQAPCLNDLNRIVELINGDNGNVVCGFLAVLIAAQDGAIQHELDNIEGQIANFEEENPDLIIECSKSALWRYPMTWRYDQDYPYWNNYQNWQGYGLCIKIQ